MKKIQKFILPVLIILGLYLIYTFYFSGSKGLGSFSDFDPNNNANKDIVIRIVAEKGITPDNRNGLSIFYAEDKNGTVVMIQGPLMLPPGIQTAEVVRLRGHLHKEYFHAAEVFIE